MSSIWWRMWCVAALGLGLLIFASPAQADIQLTAPGGTVFTIQDSLGGGLSGPATFESWPQLCVRSCPAGGCPQVLCDASDIYSAGGVPSTVEANGRQRHTAPKTMPNGLVVSRRIFVPSAGVGKANQYIRYVDELRNPTGAAIVASVRLGSVSVAGKIRTSTTIWRTHDDDADWDPTDRWILLDDNVPLGGSAAIGVLLHGAGARVLPTSVTEEANGEGGFSWEYHNIIVPAGQTISLLTAVVSEPMRQDALDEVFYLKRANPPDLLADLTEQQRRQIYNIDVDPDNGAPTAEAGGPYWGDEGAQIQLWATESFDPEGDNLTYEWDLDGDGVFDDAFTANVRHVFPNDGIYYVQVRVTDAGGKSDIDSAKVTVFNRDPSIDQLLYNSEINEGDFFDLTIIASDPGGDVLSYEVDWLGTGQYVAAQAENNRYRYMRDGTYNIGIRVSDGDGGMAFTTIQLVVHNLPPIIDQVVHNTPVLEGDTVHIVVVARDPGNDPIYYEYDLDNDGEYELGGAGLSEVETSFPNEGFYTINIRVRDDKGATTTTTRNLSILNAPPVIHGITSTSPAYEGESIQFTVNASDAGVFDVLTYSFDFLGNGDFSSPQAQPTASYVFPQEGRYEVVVRVSDGSLTVEGRIEVDVLNAPPEITRFYVDGAALDEQGRAVVSEGAPFTLRVEAADPSLEELSYAFDGTGNGIFDVADSPQPSYTTQIFEKGARTLKVRVTDSHGAQAEATLEVWVKNVAPTVQIDVDSPQYEGSDVVVRVNATDPGADELRYSYDFDSDGVYEITDSLDDVARHRYPRPGTYTITVKVDDGHESVTATATIEVLNVAPTLRITANSPLREGEELILTAEATDPSDDVLTVEWQVRGQTYERELHEPEDAELRLWMVNNDTFTVTAVVRDEQGAVSDEARVQVVVYNVAPVFLAMESVPRALEGTDYDFLPRVFDPGAEDVLTFRFDGQPPLGASIDPATGRVTWVPTYQQYLDSPITLAVAVEDGDGGLGRLTLEVPVDPIDEDNDGIPDTFERMSCTEGWEGPCLDPENPNDGIQDYDNDGVSNYDEWLEGRDPFSYDGPEVPVLVAPEDGEEVRTYTPTFKFEPLRSNLDEAIYLEFEIYSDEALTLPVFQSEMILQEGEEGIEHRLGSGLLYEDFNYYWRARAHGDTAITEWSAVWHFQVNVENEPPSTPVQRAPADGAQVADLAPTLEALPSIDPEGDEIEYVFRIYRADTGGLIQSGLGVESEGVVRYSTATASLLENGTYEWDVFARDHEMSSEPSPRWRFMINLANDAPSAPEIIKPVDQAWVDNPRPLMVAGGSVDHDDEEIFYHFSVRLKGESDYLERGEPIAAGNAEEVSWIPERALKEDRWHTLEVFASDGRASSPISSVDFFVSEQNDPPPAPQLTSPHNGARVRLADAYVIWETVEDPEGSEVTYVVRICEEGAAEVCQDYAAQLQRGRDVVDFVKKGTSYVWSVTAFDQEGNASPPSESWIFTIEGSASTGGGGSSADSGCQSGPSSTPTTLGLLALGLLGLMRRRRTPR